MTRGLRIVDGQDLEVINYGVDTGNGTAIFKNGGVVANDTGGVDGMSAASDDYAGIAQTIYNSGGVEVDTLAASTAGSVDVATNPYLNLLVEADGEVTETDRNNLADLASYGGSTSTGESSARISSTTGTGCAQFRILDKLDTPGNAWGDTDIKLVVQAAEHYKLYKTGV